MKRRRGVIHRREITHTHAHTRTHKHIRKKKKKSKKGNIIVDNQLTDSFFSKQNKMKTHTTRMDMHEYAY
jgi:hypothetical protein